MALVEDLSLVPSTHAGQLTTSSNSSSWGPNTFFWPPGAPECMYGHAHPNTHTYRNKNSSNRGKTLENPSVAFHFMFENIHIKKVKTVDLPTIIS